MEIYTLLVFISSFEGIYFLLFKNFKIQLDLYFLVFYVSFCISRYHFKNFIQHDQKRRIFVTNFPFLTDSLKLPQPP